MTVTVGMGTLKVSVDLVLKLGKSLIFASVDEIGNLCIVFNNVSTSLKDDGYDG